MGTLETSSVELLQELSRLLSETKEDSSLEETELEELRSWEEETTLEEFGSLEEETAGVQEARENNAARMRRRDFMP